MLNDNECKAGTIVDTPRQTVILQFFLLHIFNDAFKPPLLINLLVYTF